MYGEQVILAEGRIPRELVLASRHYLSQLRGVRPPGGVRVHISGIDLIRDPAGTFRVLEDNLRTPSGVSYVLENRLVSKRVMPRAVDAARVQRVDHYPARLADTLRSVAAETDGDPTMVLLTPDPFNIVCGGSAGACVPQAGVSDKLDTLGDRSMFRNDYRRFSDGHEALVGNMTVDSNGVAGIRWWEINNATSGSPGFAQQSTYQPDNTYRWMGSAAMDASGDIAVGFSASSSSINPQILHHLMKACNTRCGCKSGKSHTDAHAFCGRILRVCKMREPVCRRETHESASPSLPGRPGKPACRDGVAPRRSPAAAGILSSESSPARGRRRR